MNSGNPQNQAEKTYLLAHQNVCITSVDFPNKKLVGFVELHFIPLKLKLSRIRLNAKQCLIKRLLAKGSKNYYPCSFTYNDPLLEVVPIEPPDPDGLAPPPPQERNLKKYNSKHLEAVYSVESEHGNGEVIITLPDEVQADISDGSTFKILVEYSIENPQGGIHFVIPEEEQTEAASQQPTTQPPPPTQSAPPPATTANSNSINHDDAQQTTREATSKDTSVNETPQTNGFLDSANSPDQDSERSSNGVNPQHQQQPSAASKQPDTQPPLPPPLSKISKYAHLFTYKTHNSSRLWFPCVDSFGQRCTWLLEFTIPSHMIVISCGDVVGTFNSKDRKTKTFRFELNIPTSARNIGFALGQFETWIDSSNCSIKNYFLSGLDKLAKASCGFLSECLKFYEEFLTFKYPYTNYKQVFVHNAYESVQSFATLSICCTNLLHSKHIIDQTFITRTVLSDALAMQYFECFVEMQTWSSAWLTRGISSYLAAQYRRKAFGNNEYRFKVQETMKKLIDYEQKYGGIVLDETSNFVNRNTFHFSTKSPHTISPFFDEAHKLKSFLVIRMLEDRIGKLLLVQVFNKILSLASNASQQPASTNLWSNMLLSTSNFERAVFTVTGMDKEMSSFLEHWIYQSGHAKFNASFIFDRKRNVIELQIRQPDTSMGIRSYFGPITVALQELDGTFVHKLNIEENKTSFVITCHSKSRRNKKKKIPLFTGEEVDMDLSMMDDSPILWLRLDPDMQILRQISLEQPDYMWLYELKYERDVTAQLDSLQVLINYPTIATRKTLTDIIENDKCYYRVRCLAALNLTKVANEMAITTTTGGWQASSSMINIYKRLFGSHSCPNIIRSNNFSSTTLELYFLQKTIPKALGGLRQPPHKICPPEVLKFLLELFKYNDNSKNNYSDAYFISALIDGLVETITPVVVSLFNNSMQPTTFDQLPSETKLVADEITRYLNLEKILPCYKNTITVAALKAISQLQRMGHLPSNPHLFRAYTSRNCFIDVRCQAVVELVDIIKTEHKFEHLDFLLDMVGDPEEVPAFKFFILSEFQNNTPNIQSFPHRDVIQEKIWNLMNSGFPHDSKLRCASADVFHKFFGRSDRLLSSFGGGDMHHKSKKKKKKKSKSKDRDKDKDRDKKKKKKMKISL